MSTEYKEIQINQHMTGCWTLFNWM